MKSLVALGVLLAASASALAQVNLASATLPGARTVAANETATIFASVINPSDTPLTGCRVEIDENYSGQPDLSLTFQRTDTQNQLIGTANAPFELGPGSLQTLLVGLTPHSQLAGVEIGLIFQCEGGTSRVISEVNTIRLTAQPAAPDLIPVALTPSGDGVLRIASSGGANAFSVAVMNIGAAAEVTARVDFGRYTWPVSLTLCPTDPVSGACLLPPAASHSQTLGQNDVQTYSVFAVGDTRLGTPFLPDIARIVVNFETGSGDVLATTSVALTTPEANSYRLLDVQAAADLAFSQGVRAVLIERNGETLFEAYSGAGGVDVAEVLHSGTKSFSCLSQALALDLGLFNPDDLAWSGISEWAPDSGLPGAVFRQEIRGRDLLSLSHGLLPDNSAPPFITLDSYREAFEATQIYRADRHAIYGRPGFQAFAALFELRTGGQIDPDGQVRGGQDPAALIDQYIATPLGIDIVWARDANGKPNFSAGARLTARDWARYGRLLLDDGVWEGTPLLSPSSIRRCMHYRTDAYAGYGLSFWINRDVGDTYQSDRDSLPPEALRHMPTQGRMLPSAPDDLYAAWGAQNMRMHMIPSEDLVIVTFGGEGDPDLFYQALFGLN